MLGNPSMGPGALIPTPIETTLLTHHDHTL